MNWKPFREGANPPPRRDCFLVCLLDDHVDHSDAVLGVSYWDPEKQKWDESVWPATVTHWMELPELPVDLVV